MPIWRCRCSPPGSSRYSKRRQRWRCSTRMCSVSVFSNWGDAGLSAGGDCPASGVEHVQPEQGTTLAEMVAENLVVKRRQIAAYTVLIRELGDKDLTTGHLAVGLLVATEKQATELAAYLKGSAQTQS